MGPCVPRSRRASVLGITADRHKTEALLQGLLNGLVLVEVRPCRACSGPPPLLPDGVEARASSFAVAVYIGQAEALLFQGVEGRLVGIAVETVLPPTRSRRPSKIAEPRGSATWSWAPAAIPEAL
jgi:hypothetical protein